MRLLRSLARSPDPARNDLHPEIKPRSEILLFLFLFSIPLFLGCHLLAFWSKDTTYEKTDDATKSGPVDKSLGLWQG